MTNKIYVAKKEMNAGKTTNIPILRGQMFYVNDYTELPCEKGTNELVEYWQELTLHNNYGNIVLIPKN